MTREGLDEAIDAVLERNGVVVARLERPAPRRSEDFGNDSGESPAALPTPVDDDASQAASPESFLEHVAAEADASDRREVARESRRRRLAAAREACHGATSSIGSASSHAVPVLDDAFFERVARRRGDGSPAPDPGPVDGRSVVADPTPRAPQGGASTLAAQNGHGDDGTHASEASSVSEIEPASGRQGGRTFVTEDGHGRAGPAFEGADGEPDGSVDVSLHRLQALDEGARTSLQGAGIVTLDQLLATPVERFCRITGLDATAHRGLVHSLDLQGSLRIPARAVDHLRAVGIHDVSMMARAEPDGLAARLAARSRTIGEPLPRVLAGRGAILDLVLRARSLHASLVRA